MKTGTTVKRWYILVIAGQSNAQGYGEAIARPGDDDGSGRIRQLGRYRGIRPDNHFEDRWNRLIPAGHVLDHVKDMRFANLAGNSDLRRSGTVGPGVFIAQKLLPLLPPDAGILLLPQAHGGAGMTFGDNGSYTDPDHCGSLRQPGAQTGRAVFNYPDIPACNIDGAMRWDGPDSALYLDLRYRLRHALALNSANRLLGIVWVQGESDAHAGLVWASAHGEAFRNMVDRLGNDLSDLDGQFLSGSWDRTPWITVLATHWWNEQIPGHKLVIDGYRQLALQRPTQMVLLDLRRSRSGTWMETNLYHYIPPASAAYPVQPDENLTDGRSCEAAMIHIHLSSAAYRGEVSERIAEALAIRALQS